MYSRGVESSKLFVDSSTKSLLSRELYKELNELSRCTLEGRVHLTHELKGHDSTLLYGPTVCARSKTQKDRPKMKKTTPRGIFDRPGGVDCFYMTEVGYLDGPGQTTCKGGGERSSSAPVY